MVVADQQLQDIGGHATELALDHIRWGTDATALRTSCQAGDRGPCGDCRALEVAESGGIDGGDIVLNVGLSNTAPIGDGR